MKKTPIFIISLLLIGIFLNIPSFANAQIDPTAQAATVEALVQERFKQTEQASSPDLTATADAMATLIEQSAQEAFNVALTATASAQIPPTATLPTTDAAGQNGVQLEFELIGDDIDDDDLEDAHEIIVARLAGLGITDAQVTRTRGDRAPYLLTVTMPIQDALDNVIESLTMQGLVEFVDLGEMSGDLSLFKDAILITTEGEENRRENLAEQHPDAILNTVTNAPFRTIIDNDDIDDVRAVFVENSNQWVVQFEFDDDGAEDMSEYSRNNIGKAIAITRDGHVISTAVIQGEFGREGGQIAGNFTEDDAKRLVLDLDLGELPGKLQLLNTSTVSLVAQAATPALTATPDPRPTATVAMINVAEQVFENGRMFWVEPTGQIWIMFTGEQEGQGAWGIYEDTFADGEPEFDPSLLPPDGLIQPERGFGKLWRENNEIREQLGWAVTPEFGYQSNYRYQPGGTALNGTVDAQPGYHILHTLYSEAIRFNETEMTWELDRPE